MTTPSPLSYEELQRRLAELDRKLAEKEDEILLLRRDLARIDAIVRSLPDTEDVLFGPRLEPELAGAEAEPEEIRVAAEAAEEREEEPVREEGGPTPSGEAEVPSGRKKETAAGPGPEGEERPEKLEGEAVGDGEHPPVAARVESELEATVSDEIAGGGVAAEPPTGPPGEAATMDLETRIGSVWFLRVGLVLLLISFAWFALYVHEYMQAWQKVAISYLVSVAVTGVGWYFEDRLRLFARPVMAAGLASAFFVSYAAFFVKPMACFPLWASLATMALSVAGIVGCAERWRSESTAGLAIFLGHVAAYVSGGQSDAFSLVAIVFLSATALVLLLRHDWLPLTLFSVLAAFLSHLLWWLQGQGPMPPEAEFWLNFQFLTSYYLIFLFADSVYRHRVWNRGVDTYSPAQRIWGRAVGPAAMILYATYVAGLFQTTRVYWDSIHFFLFPLAAVQLLVALYHRRKANPDYPIYVSACAVFATLGFFSWIEGLSLNMTLGAEALLLLVLARRLRLWFLNPLAQVVLAINFIHYWTSDVRDPATTGAFLGCLVTAAVYFVTARLEETWKPIPRDEAIGESAWVAEARGFFDRFVGPVAYVHAFAGGLIVVHQCMRYLDAPWQAAVLAAISLATAAVVFGWWSRGMVIAAWVLQAGCVYALLNRAAENLVTISAANTASVKPSIEWMVGELVVAAIVGCGVAALAVWRTARAALLCVLAVGSFAFGIPAAIHAAGIGEPLVWSFPLWMIGPLAYWVAVEMIPTRLPEHVRWSGDGFVEIEMKFLEWRPFFRGSLAVIAAILTAYVAIRVFPQESGALWFLSIANVALLFAGLRRDSPWLVLGLIASVSLTLGYHAIYRAADAVATAPGLTWWLSACAVAIACVLTFTGMSRRRGSFLWGGVTLLGAFLAGIVRLSLDQASEFSPFWLWLVTLAGVWVVAESIRIRVAGSAAGLDKWRDTVGAPALLRFSRNMSMGLSIAGAVALTLMVDRHWYRAGDVCLTMLVFTLLFGGAALGLRSVSLCGAYAVLLGMLHLLFHLLIGTRDAAAGYKLLASFVVAGTLLCAGITERLLNRHRASMSGPQRYWAATGSWCPDLLGLLLGTLVIGQLVLDSSAPVVMQFPPQLLFALAVLAIAGWARLGRMQLVALSFGMFFVGHMMANAVSEPACRETLAFAGLLVFGQTIIAERVLVLQSRETLDEFFEGREGTDPLETIRAVLIVSGTIVILYALFGADEIRRLRGYWTTAGWSLVALAQIALGFWWKERTYRRVALVVFGLSIVRILAVDTVSLGLLYRTLVGFFLAICLLTVAFLYTRFRMHIQRWL